jgi:hypothetical protein
MRFAPIIALAFLSGLALVAAIDVPTVYNVTDPDENDPNAVPIHVAAEYDHSKLAFGYGQSLANLNANGDPETREALARLQAAHDNHARQHIKKAQQVALKQANLTTVSDPPPGVDPAKYHIDTAVSHIQGFQKSNTDSRASYLKGQTTHNRSEAIDQYTASIRSHASAKKSQAFVKDHIAKAAKHIPNQVTSFHNDPQLDPSNCYFQAAVHHEQLRNFSLEQSEAARQLGEQAMNPGDMTSHAWNSAKLLSEAKGHDKQKRDNLSKSQARSMLSRGRKSSEDKFPPQGPGGGSRIRRGGTGRLGSPLGRNE